ncbi:Tom37 C-terminal domain-containing protein [Pyronema domesticum]|uniref:Similar to Metaxin-like protein C409.19c acc. no. Q9UUA5 n=1 Tax=Pyronema omphalodes (strain CBS 100304) TaxID=1076935 RepID=U4LUD3_PYROM|nr:Tom37 C-terminal domain-containing protein [Pyronema domesticum]CCX33600.1 Similar to Metaxin-like protein C409.19c; acc. no. Q9UUA5 [Pyronema omphalodes CBS 100304]
MLELHIWGPGFGLPSIDPQCLAAIAYMILTVPKEDWKIVPSSNPQLAPSQSLPALRTSSTLWSCGLPNIISHLRQLYPSSDLDSFLPPRDAALNTAFTSYITSRGQELLDLSLYVSHKNFSSVTRPVFSSLLGWPVCYYHPLSARNAARERVRHLGFSSSIDITKKAEDVMAPLGETPGERAAREAADPKPRNNALGELAVGIKLSAMMNDFLGPLEKQLGEHRSLLGGQTASVDCVMLGYLALMLVPEMPKAWAKEGLDRHPNLKAWTEEFIGRVFADLPMGEVERGDVAWLGGVVYRNFIDNLPVIGKKEKVKNEEDPMLDASRKRAEALQRKEWWKSVLFITGGVVGMITYIAWSGIIRIQTGGEEGGEEEEGEEGEAEGEEVEEIEVDDDEHDE